LRVLVLENNGIPNPKDKDKKKSHIIISFIFLKYITKTHFLLPLKSS